MLTFNVLDTETSYRAMLATPDAETREAIFSRELIAPFQGLVDIMGGGNGIAAFRQWQMTAEQFAPQRHAEIERLLNQLKAADAWNRAADSLIKGRDAFTPYLTRINLPTITFGLMLADLSNMPLQHGYTGFGSIPGWVMTVYGEASAYNLERVEACTVHELHHNLCTALLTALGRAKPIWEVTLGEYMLNEGLAESFAAELYGEDKIGPWVTEFDQRRFEEARRMMKANLSLTGFNAVRAYIFGDTLSGQNLGVPDLCGYAMGYHMVQTYLKKTGKSVVEATVTPAEQVIHESGFFTA